MQVYITRPHGALCGGLLDKLENRWRLSAKDASAELHFIEAPKHTIHGDLLTMLWDSSIKDSSDPIHVISEIDFIPNRGSLTRVQESAALAKLNLLGCHYINRDYAPLEEPARSRGKLVRFDHEGLPLLGPWFLFLDLSRRMHRSLPLDWLSAAGPRNDAGNLAIHHGTKAGFLTPNNYAFLEGRDAWPAIHGIRYRGVGTHCFFCRALDLPDDIPVCWLDQPNTLRAGQHRDNIRLRLIK